jgi:copper chaperone CopZ
VRTILAAILLAAAAPALAAPQAITVKVNGLVCDFCARSIESMMKKRSDVTRVHVDLDKGEIHLATKDESLDNATLKRLVIDSGYAVTAIERSQR